MQGTGRVPFNPVRVVEVIAQRCWRGEPARLRELYDLNVGLLQR
ncbi:MAG TPA: hypothetical protein VHE35_26035 [Kofleriaceae bacterium]|nr:hypothetical protein [Kofleriaceae bacterium]